ncbi:MAG: glycosyltransferase family 4 protein [Planctomycetota bacterium]
MHILYIHQHFATPQSASGTRSFVFSKKLLEAGHKVTILTSEGYLPQEYRRLQHFEVEGIKVVNIRSGYTLRMSFWKRVMSFLKFVIGAVREGMRAPVDFVFATSTPLTVAIPALVMKFMRNIPFVFELRDLWPDVPVELGLIKNRMLIFLARYLEKTAYRSADRIVCISDGICQNVAAPPKKKITIPTGCDLHAFQAKKDARWKKESGIREKALFVFTGAIGEANAPDYLIEAARILQDDGQNDIAIALIGAGSAKERVKSLKDSYMLENVYLYDPLPKNLIPQVLAAADGGIILHGFSRLYRETAMPNKFFDYIAAGLPVIFNFEGPLRDQILTHQAGFYVDYRKPEELSRTLVMLFENPEIGLEVGIRARRMAEEYFDQEKLAEKFVMTLAEVVTA